MPSIRKKTLHIDGMTCVNCENRIERKLQSKLGITSVEASYSAGTAVVCFDESVIGLTDIERLIEQLHYKVRKSSQQSVDKNVNSTQVLGVITILLALYVFIKHFGGFTIFNAFPEAKENMGYGMLFVIGLLTSVHCIAMCGGINLSQTVPQKKTGGAVVTGRLSTLRPSFLYNLGRVISYTVIGGIVGAIGSFVSFSGGAKGIVQLVAGAFMVIMGLNMLNMFPGLRKFNPRMPKVFARKINAQKSNNSPLYVGLLNGLMPCGPLQAMQLYALSTGNAASGALSMFLFSLGTVPLMFGLGALSSILSKKFTSKMMTASAVLVVALGIFMFSSGMSLSGIAIPPAASGASGNVAQIKDGFQTVTTTLSSGRYQPITVQKGIPVKWIIQAEDGNLNGCNNRMIIPKYNLEKKLEPGETVIVFTPTESGAIPYSCWMGMIRSSITVVDDINNLGTT
ncbi:MAG: sulfite exporter TauE/SafE family protein [Gorillibacterium sp.]|nr:sulfite exporter TauE/SafE family protein [Gorillibacterium sp.]